MQNLELVNARKFAGMSQDKLAELLGVSRRTVIRMEQGKTKVPPIDFYKLFGTLVSADKKRPYLAPEPTTPLAPKPMPTGTMPKHEQEGDQSRPRERTWRDIPPEDLKDYLLDIAVGVYEQKAYFDVPDLLVELLRFWGKDATVIRDAWQIIFFWLRSAEDVSGWVTRINPGIKDSDRWRWELTQKGWEEFEKGSDSGMAKDYPNAYARLFESLA